MRILYIAKHGSGGNNDEDAVSFALRKLGHEVDCVHERNVYVDNISGDFCLFHHWHDIRTMSAISNKSIPLVFWNFDLVEWPDPTLEARNVMRRTWMHEVMKVVDLGFCTDGDWVAKHPDKLVWLTQGFDERQQPAPPTTKTIPILFTGIGKGGGIQRESFVAEMRDKYGEGFLHYIKGLHGDKLAAMIAQAKIVVAPDSPVTDRYWSNRVYNVLGMGGFLLHPYASGLDDQYNIDKSSFIDFYKTRQEMHDTIEWIIDPHYDKLRYTGSEMCRIITLKEHTYRHRCEVLVSTVKARLGL